MSPTKQQLESLAPKDPTVFLRGCPLQEPVCIFILKGLELCTPPVPEEGADFAGSDPDTYSLCCGMLGGWVGGVTQVESQLISRRQAAKPARENYRQQIVPVKPERKAVFVRLGARLESKQQTDSQSDRQVVSFVSVLCFRHILISMFYFYSWPCVYLYLRQKCHPLIFSIFI